MRPLLPEEVASIDYENAAFIADALTALGAPDPGRSRGSTTPARASPSPRGRCCSTRW